MLFLLANDPEIGDLDEDRLIEMLNILEVEDREWDDLGVEMEAE